MLYPAELLSQGQRGVLYASATKLARNLWRTPWLRRERDSNPRYRFRQYTRLASEHLRPLGHLSLIRGHQALGFGAFGPCPPGGLLACVGSSVFRDAHRRRRRDSNPRRFRAAVFKTAAFVHSATPPRGGGGHFYRRTPGNARGKCISHLMSIVRTPSRAIETVTAPCSPVVRTRLPSSR
jgi:hypothetical protein